MVTVDVVVATVDVPPVRAFINFGCFSGLLEPAEALFKSLDPGGFAAGGGGFFGRKKNVGSFCFTTVSMTSSLDHFSMGSLMRGFVA